MRMLFNFRDVLHQCGLPLTDNKTNWAVGQMLSKIADDMNVEPARVLTEKTDPSPSVAAPHCISHYPMKMFATACKRVLDWHGDRSRQLPLFD